MNPKYEKRLLQKVLSQLDSPTKKRRGSQLVSNLLLWIGVFSVMLVFFQFGPSPHWTDALLAGVCISVGFLIAYDVYKSMYQNQWPIVSRYVDRAQIEARLHELGA